MISTNESIDNIQALHFAGEKLTEEQELMLVEWTYLHKDEYRKLSDFFLTQDAQRKGGKGMNFDSQRAWKRVEKKCTQRKMFRLHDMNRYLAYAACVLAVVGMAVLLLNRKDGTERVYENSTMDLMAVVLPDNSMVTLYPDTKLSYRSGDGNGQRNTTLEGKAFFKVMSDAKRPFVVMNGETAVRVLGTSFVVDHSKKTETGVYVREGKVQVSTRQKQVVLEDGQQALVKQGEIEKTDMEYLDEVFGMVVLEKSYRNQMLAALIKDIETEFGVHIEVDETLRDVRVTTQLKFLNLEELLEEICYICNCRYRKVEEKRYKIYP